jgi:hypothetical protein
MPFCFKYRSYCHELHVQGLKSLQVANKIKECLEQKKFKQYSATTSHANLGADTMFFKDQMNAQFIIKLASKKRNVFEEILILDEIGLVGSLGGSLGLFVGFSFFGYATPILEAAFNKVADFLARCQLVGQVKH